MPRCRQRHGHHPHLRPRNPRRPRRQGVGSNRPPKLMLRLAVASVMAPQRMRRIGGPRRFQKGAHRSGSHLSPTGRHRNICCRVLRAAAASRLDEHKGKLQHIHDRNNHNTPQNTSRNLELTHTRRICSTYTVNNPNTQADDQTNTQTNEPTNMQTANQSIKRTN